MKKTVDIVIKNYVFATLVEQGGKALVYFMNIENENECVMIPFMNGYEETTFLMDCFGRITKWYKGIDAWKKQEIKVVHFDGRPLALVDCAKEEICIIRSPILTYPKDIVIQNGNLLYLEKMYGITEEQLKLHIKKELQKDKNKLYQKKR